VRPSRPSLTGSARSLAAIEQLRETAADADPRIALTVVAGDLLKVFGAVDAIAEGSWPVRRQRNSPTWRRAYVSAQPCRYAPPSLTVWPSMAA
jgi:hypothetical protein